MGKNKKASKTVALNETRFKGLRIFLLAAVSLVIFYPPYLQGLFFEKDVLPTGIFVFAVFIVFLVYKWLKKDFAFLKTPIEYIALAFVAAYFISIFAAVHTRSAIVEWLKYCMYFAVFYMIIELADDLKTRILFIWTIIASAVGVSIIGLDSAIGGKFVGVLNKIFNIFGYKGDMFFGLFVSNRINSTLQYPNALASYVMAVFFITIGMLLIQKKWWQKAIAGACSFILFTTFILTYSRGAQLLFPAVLINFFLVMPKGNRIKAVTHVLLLSVPAAVIALIINPHLSSENHNIKALGLLLAGAVLSGLIGIVSEHIGSVMQKINWKVYVGLIVVFIVVVIAGGIYVINQSVPVELKNDKAAEDIYQSVSKNVALEPEREYLLTYEADAWMSEEKPYAFVAWIYNRSEEDILFSGNTQLLRENFQATEGIEEKSIKFTTPEDSKMISIVFSNYFAGTGVRIDNVKIVDAKTNKTYNIALKNKYNLDSFIYRFQNIWLHNSLISRAIFYKDGFEIFKDRWLLGAGGGAWNYLYRRYQSYNYASSQAHNFPLQLGIETGIIGLLVLLCLTISLVYTYLKYYKKEKQNNCQENNIKNDNTKTTEGFLNASVITAVAALLLHSVIDFDFSEASMLFLFWQLIAVFVSNMRVKLIPVEMLPFEVIKKNKVQKNKKSVDTKTRVVFGILLSIITFAFSCSFFIASVFAEKAYDHLKSNNIQKAIESTNKAISFDSFNEKYITGYNPLQARPDIKTGLADLLFIKNDSLKSIEQKGEKIPEIELLILQQQFDDVNKRINELEKKAENNLNLASNIASYYFKTGQTEKGLEYLNSAIIQFPFEPSLWHSKADIYFQLMGKHFNNGDDDLAKEYIDFGLNIIDEAKDINKRNMNPFIFKEETASLLQRLQFMKDYWDQEELKDINRIVHYSIIDMDLDMDYIPDQWKISDTSLINASIADNAMEIKATGRSYIYCQYSIKLEKGKTYQIDVKLKNPVDYLAYHISGITSHALPLTMVNGNYSSDLLVENEPSENGNEFRLYFESDCIIERILVKEKEAQ